MTTASTAFPSEEVIYPTSDGKPMAETELHRDLMIDTIRTLQAYFAQDKMVCVSGNMFVYYEKGNKRRHVAPDVFVVKGVPQRRRDYYQIWEEGKTLDLAIELTSTSTQDEDTDDKKDLYRDVLKVQEYFLFDPRAEYLEPPLQGYRLVDGDYVRIEPVNGRLPSEILGLHLEANGAELRLWDPATGSWLPTPAEKEEQQEAKLEQQEEKLEQQEEKLKQQEAKLEQQEEKLRQQEEKLNRELLIRRQAEEAHDKEVAARRKAEEEIARLRAQLSGGQRTPPKS